MQKIFTIGEKKLLKVLKIKYFVLEEQTRYEKEEKNIKNENGLIDYKKLGRLIDLKERDISDELVRKYFLVQYLGALLENLKKLKNNPKRNKNHANVIKSGLRDLGNWKYE